MYIHTYINTCIQTYIHTDRQTYIRTSRFTVVIVQPGKIGLMCALSKINTKTAVSIIHIATDLINTPGNMALMHF